MALRRLVVALAGIAALAAGVGSAAGVQGGPVAGIGTGATHGTTYVAVTGGGAFPSTSGAPTCSDAACLAAAASVATSTPLLVGAGADIAITTPIHVRRSIVGVGSPPPVIRQLASCGKETCAILQLEPGFSGWIYNLHLVGTFSGGTSGEWAHGIDFGAVNGVTVKGNLVEDVQGDCFGTDYASWPASIASAPTNVLIDNNTCRNPYRCAYACSYRSDTWALTNNVFEKQASYVHAIDFEPEQLPGGSGYCRNIEVAYNRFVMRNRTGERGHGKAVSRWSPIPQPGSTPGVPGDFLYVHHNYGTYGTGSGATPWWLDNGKFGSRGRAWGKHLVLTPNGADGSTAPP